MLLVFPFSFFCLKRNGVSHECDNQMGNSTIHRITHKALQSNIHSHTYKRRFYNFFPFAAAAVALFLSFLPFVLFFPHAFNSKANDGFQSVSIFMAYLFLSKSCWEILFSLFMYTYYTTINISSDNNNNNNIEI